MKTITRLIAAAVVLAATACPAAERIRIAALPPTGAVKKVAQVHTGEFVQQSMIDGMSKIERFDQLSVGDVQRLMEENLVAEDDLKVEKAAQVAKKLGVRLLLFTTIHKADIEIETEDKVLIKTTVAVATGSLEATLFDAATGETTKIGPYEEEERYAGSEGAKARFTLTPEKQEQIIKAALESSAKKIRARLYKLYPLAGVIQASDGKTFTLDIGTKMGVAVGQKYSVFGMVEKENPMTGLKEKMRAEVSVIEVTEVAEDTAVCKAVKGDANPLIGSAVERSLRE